eukprot:Blabericola_migrator_1__12828@NODE_82_length_14933_cov_91_583546_g73_i0_p7_GENE_NODE_82_length_14933_cov_91_583546_g73_i0NODE_82_length_14933_cov_91_583546_g73_i0_p7_ORF_typecomplete_len151_score16_93DUF423/PF04241_15/0_13DUF1700/PF08006_11/0_12Ykof/PF07615_11/0_42Ykof/PF07615_11/7_3e03_NODE_82_length_14933_cov_91_583546_g73_i01340613858
MRGLLWILFGCCCAQRLRGLAPEDDFSDDEGLLMNSTNTMTMAPLEKQLSREKQEGRQQDVMHTLEKQWQSFQQKTAPAVHQAHTFLTLSFVRIKEAISHLETWQAVLVLIGIALLTATFVAAIVRCIWALTKLVCCPCSGLVAQRPSRH